MSHLNPAEHVAIATTTRRWYHITQHPGRCKDQHKYDNTILLKEVKLNSKTIIGFPTLDGSKYRKNQQKYKSRFKIHPKYKEYKYNNRT